MSPAAIYVEYLPTMSRTDELLACPWPWGKMVPVEGEIEENTRYGSAYHEAVEALLKEKLGPHDTRHLVLVDISARHEIDTVELGDHLEATYPTLLEWLQDYGYNIVRAIECPIAYNVKKKTVRRCAPPDAGHRYTDRKPWELPGTLDLIACDPQVKKWAVIDHKTGQEIPSVSTSGQLRSQALAVAVESGVEKVTAGYFHAPRGSRTATVFSDVFYKEDLAQHALALSNAYRRIGLGLMRPGVYCGDCAALNQCPTSKSALATMRSALDLDEVGSDSFLALAPEKVGEIYEMLRYNEAIFERLSGSLRQLLRRWLEENRVPAPLAGGQVLDLVPRKSTNLSMASIKRALGDVEGSKMIEKLRKLGCIEEGERVEMRPMKDAGR